MFKHWMEFLVFVLSVSGVAALYVVIQRFALERTNGELSDIQLIVFAVSALSFGVAAGLLAISLLARSINQGRLVIFRPLFIKMFEGMTFFKWGILIIGLVIALAFLEIAGN